MPALSPTMTAGNLMSWKKGVGDAIQVGDILAEIETDKATMDFESLEEGYLAKIIVPEGTKDVAINEPIAIISENQEDVNAFKDFVLPAGANKEASHDSGKEDQDKQKVESTEHKQPAKSQGSKASSKETSNVAESEPVKQASPSPAPSSSTAPRQRSSPMVKSIAKKAGLDLSQVSGSGPNGRVLKTDLKPFLDLSPFVASRGVISSDRTHTDIELTNMRKTIAKRLTESATTIPQFYLTTEIVVDGLLDAREAINSSLGGAVRLSINDFIVKASSRVLAEFPQVNASWMGDSIRQYSYVDISVAVATENGLITPILKDCHLMSIFEISQSIKDLAKKAKNNKLQPDEFQGGTFTISNLGMYGIQDFTAIINPPQSCILAVGGVEKKMMLAASDEPLPPVLSETSLPESVFEVQSVIKVTLTCDHRVVDGALGAQFLNKLKSLMESPHLLLGL